MVIFHLRSPQPRDRGSWLREPGQDMRRAARLQAGPSAGRRRASWQRGANQEFRFLRNVYCADEEKKSASCHPDTNEDESGNRSD